MPMQGRTKQILAILVVVVLIAGGGLAAVVTTLVKNAPPELPTITAYAHGKSVEVGAMLCDPNLRCADPQVADLPVPAGAILPSPGPSTLSLSLPKEIADGDWQLYYAFRDLRTGQVYEDTRTFAPGEAYAVTRPAASWTAGYAKIARTVPGLPEHTRRIDGALRAVGDCLDPLLGGHLDTGSWDPIEASWSPSPTP